MDKLRKLVRFDGIRGLPPGFRFEPTEEELVFEYLKCKVLSSPNLNLCASSIIPEISDVWNFDPWDLPGGDGSEEEIRYLFSNRKSKSGKRSKKWTTPSGYWKATGNSDTKIVPSTASNWNDCNVGVGIKRALAFFATPGEDNANIKKRPKKTRWVMHEYSLILPATAHDDTQTQMDMDGNWVVCRIFCSKPSTKNTNTNTNYDFMHYGRSSSTCASVSSSSSSSYNPMH